MFPLEAAKVKNKVKIASQTHVHMNWIKELDNINKVVSEEFASIPDEVLNKKPGSEKWSVSENFQHIMKVNNSYFPLFEKLKKGNFQAPFIAKIPFFSKLFGNMIFQSVSDGGKKKVKTFPAWQPEPVFYDNTISDFLQHQILLAEKIKEMEPFTAKKVIIHSPVNKLIVYSLDQAIDIIIAHEWRHLDQAKQVLENSK